MPRKVLIVGAAVVAAIVVFLVWRRRAAAAGAPYAGATMSPQAAIATLTATPPSQLAAAAVQYGVSQIAGAAGYAGVPQTTAKPVGTTYTGQACPEGAYVDPETGKCGSNRLASILNHPSVRALNYNPSAGYYG